jgi:preprotein translocase subunit Sec61beta
MALSSPQQSAGILSFYDAPELGPKLNAKLVLTIVGLFTLLVLILDHFSTVL